MASLDEFYQSIIEEKPHQQMDEEKHQKVPFEQRGDGPRGEEAC